MWAQRGGCLCHTWGISILLIEVLESQPWILSRKESRVFFIDCLSTIHPCNWVHSFQMMACTKVRRYLGAIEGPEILPCTVSIWVAISNVLCGIVRALTKIYFCLVVWYQQISLIWNQIALLIEFLTSYGPIWAACKRCCEILLIISDPWSYGALVLCVNGTALTLPAIKCRFSHIQSVSFLALQNTLLGSSRAKQGYLAVFITLAHISLLQHFHALFYSIHWRVLILIKCASISDLAVPRVPAYLGEF